MRFDETSLIYHENLEKCVVNFYEDTTIKIVYNYQ